MWNVSFIFRSKLINARPLLTLDNLLRANMNKSHGKKQSKIKPKQQRKVHNFTTSFEVNQEHEVLSTPVKSISDKKTYRVIRLKNGLTACLVSDVGEPEKDEFTDSESGSETESSESENGSSKSTSGEEDVDHNDDAKMTKVPQKEQKMAAAALCVGVGSFSDPKDLPGLAHFVEHMVFMGSEKYPKENEFDSYIKKRGGSDNASTDCECCTFYFECLEKHLYQSLDKFSQFFISPIMKEESMIRERQAIESEFQMAVTSDNNRKEQLLLSLINPEVPINSFAWGNLKTLQGTMEDSEIHNRLHEFRKWHYSAHRMTVAIQARLPLDTLQNYVIKCFSNVPNNNLPPIDLKQYSHIIFDTPAFNRLYYVLPMKDIMEVNLVWPLPSLLDMYKSKPHEYVAHLLGDEGKGSLLSYLKKKVWALEIYAGNDECGSEYNSVYSLFTVTVTLTKEGVHHLSEVIDAVYSYIRMIKIIGPEERIFNEMKLIEDTSFLFDESESPIENVEDLSENMQYFPPEDYLSGNQIYFTYDPEAIKMILSNLVPEKMNIMVLSSTLPNEIKYDKTEPYFNIQYTDVDIPCEWKEKWQSILPYPEFSLPPPNKFLTNDFTLLPDVADNSEYPEKIFETPQMELWYRKDQTFKLPTTNYCYSFNTPLLHKTAVNACMTDMFVSLLGLQLAEDIYPAVTAELEVEMFVGDRGVIIKLEGYNEKLPVLLEMVVTFFKDVARNLNEDLFDAVKAKQKGMYYNKFLKPSALAKDIRFSILLENYWTLVEKHSAISEVTFDMMKTFSEDLVKTLHIQCLIQGNTSKDMAIQISRMVLEILQCEPLDTQPKMQVAQLPSGEYHCRVKSFNKKDSNSVIANYYQSEQFSIKTSVIIEMLMMIIEEPLFDVLRTKEQLGYHVSCTMRDTFGILGYSIMVNAQKNTTQYVDLRIEKFIKHMYVTLKKMSSNKMNELKRDLIKLKRCTDDNLTEEVNRNWGEIVSQKYMFDRLRREIDAIQDIKLADVRRFWKEHNMLTNHNSLRKLSVQVVGYNEAKNSEFKNTVTEPVNTEDHYSLELLGPEDNSNYFKYFIRDVKEFKEKLVPFPAN